VYACVRDTEGTFCADTYCTHARAQIYMDVCMLWFRRSRVQVLAEDVGAMRFLEWTQGSVRVPCAQVYMYVCMPWF
jgi:hypothetical protein